MNTSKNFYVNCHFLNGVQTISKKKWDNLQKINNLPAMNVFFWYYNFFKHLSKSFKLSSQ